MLPKLKATSVYYTNSFITSLAFAVIFTLNMVYQVETVGLSPLQLVLVGTTLEVSAFIFEIPTGIVADVYSRRLSIIVGWILLGLSALIQGAFPVFGAILLAQVAGGLGYTFTSGASEAWIADEIGPEKVGPVYMRSTQIGQIGSLLGIPLSVTLGHLALNIPILVGGGILLAMALFLALFMPEAGFQPVPPKEWETWRVMINTLRTGAQLVRVQPILWTFLGISLLVGLYSEGYDRLWTAHLIENFTFPAWGNLQPVVWFGIIRAGTQVISLGATELARRRLADNDPVRLTRILAGVYAGMVLGLVMLALARQFWLTLAALWLFGILRTLSFPLSTTWINRYLESKVRATMLSVWAQTDAIGQVAGGLFVGWIGTTHSLRAALLTSSLILAPVVPLYGVLRRQTGPDDAASPEEETLSPVP